MSEETVKTATGQAAPAASAESAAAQPQAARRNPAMTALAIICILAAVIMYGRDYRSGKRRVEAANAVRIHASVPTSAIVFVTKPEDRKIFISRATPPALTTNIVAMLQLAEPVKFPKGEQQGEEFTIILSHTNSMASVMSVAYLYEDPATVYVRAMEPMPDEKSEVRGSLNRPFRTLMPAKVADPNKYFQSFLNSANEFGAHLPPDEELLARAKAMQEKRKAEQDGIEPKMIKASEIAEGFHGGDPGEPADSKAIKAPGVAEGVQGAEPGASAEPKTETAETDEEAE